MDHLDWQRIAPEIAVQVVGEPKFKKSDEWRWNNKGSLTLNLEAGTFYDFELGAGGGVIWLLEQYGRDVAETLKQFGFDRPLQSINSSDLGNSPIAKSTSSGRSFSNEQMIRLHDESIVAVKYADNFVVMRFPEGHQISMKYAPFSRIDGSWYMKRPSEILPIYATNNYPDKPVLLNEGEKAMLGAKSISGDAFDVSCWHGGVGAINKQDWSKLFGRDVVIWCDNDIAGKECGLKIEKILRDNCNSVKVINPPIDFEEKDDLWDAAQSDYFPNLKSFQDYIYENQVPILIEPTPLVMPSNEFKFLTYEEMEENDKPPEWLIDKIAEKETVISMYAEPKAGKSFVGISMMLSVASGTEWYGHQTVESGVLYFCGEGERSIFKRILAWESHFDIPLKGKPFRVSNRPARILDDEDFENILAKSHECKNQFGSLGMVIIDTLQRNWGNGDENSTSDMNQFINRIDRIKFETGACVMLVHHTGHSGAKSSGAKRARGSSVLPASVDSEFFIERKTVKKDTTIIDIEEEVMYVKLSQTLNKEDMNMKPLNFRMDTVKKLGKAEDKKSGVLVLVKDSEMPSSYESDMPGVLKILNEGVKVAHLEKTVDEDYLGVFVTITEIIKAIDSESFNDNHKVSNDLRKYKDHPNVQYERVEGVKGKYQSKILLDRVIPHVLYTIPPIT